MKTASKLLSMLLLVAMCLSLMGGSAYATGLAPIGDTATLGLAPLGTDDSSTVGGSTGSDSSTVSSSTFDLKPLSDDADSSTTFDLEKPGLFLSKDMVCSVGDSHYTSLEAAIAAANAGETVTLLQNTSLTTSTSISKNITLDLGGKTLTLAADLVIDANVTLSNGTVTFSGNHINVQNGRTLSVYTITCHPGGFATSGTGKVQLYSGSYSVEPDAAFLPEGYVSVLKDGMYQVGPKSATYVAYVNDKGYESVNAAFEAAQDLTGAVTINLVEDDTKCEDLKLTVDVYFDKCSSVTINLNDNTLVVDSSVEFITSKPMVINGYKLQGIVIAGACSLTLNANVDGGVVANRGAALTVNGVTVGAVDIFDDSTLNMARGTIGALNVGSGANTLNVTGGTVGTSTTPAVLNYTKAVRAIRGGTWYLTDTVDELAKFDALLPDGYERSGDASPYTVVSKSGSGSGGDSGTVTGSFTLYGSPYVTGSGTSVYIDMPSKTENKYWVSKDANGHSASALTVGIDCNETAISTGYRLTLTKSFLDKLSAGTYYFFSQGPIVGANHTTLSMGALVVQSGSITINPGDAAVWPVDSAWYSGSGMYYFYVTPALQLVDGTSYDYYDVAIDGVQVGGDKLSYNGYQKFGVASSVMDSLSIGTHTMTVLTTAGYASCNFRVGATLRPVDTDKHVTGSSKNLQFVCSDSISRVWVGPTELTSLNYGDYWTLSSSGKTITLTAKFLNNLSAGNTRTLTVLTANGDQPSCTFQILTTAQASSSPRTGDESNLALWAAVLLLSGGAAVAILPRLKKHED